MEPRIVYCTPGPPSLPPATGIPRLFHRDHLSFVEWRLFEARGARPEWRADSSSPLDGSLSTVNSPLVLTRRDALIIMSDRHPLSLSLSPFRFTERGQVFPER